MFKISFSLYGPCYHLSIDSLRQWIPFKTSLLVKSDTKAVVIVIPADGPSFPIAPAGK